MFQKRSCCQSTASSSEPSQPATVSTCSWLQIYFKTPFGIVGMCPDIKNGNHFLLSFCFLSSVTTLGQIENRSFWPSFLELDILHHPLGLSLSWLENKQEHTVEISGILICDFMYVSPSEVAENTCIKLQSKPSSEVHNKASKLLISSSSSAETLETLISLSQIGCWHTFHVDCSWGCGGSSVAAILWGLRR